MSKHTASKTLGTIIGSILLVGGIFIGVILATGKSSQSPFSFAQVQPTYSIVGTRCSGTAKTCNQNKLYWCFLGIWSLFDDCQSQGLVCENGHGTLPAGCQDVSTDTFMKCTNNSVYSCLINNPTQCTFVQYCTSGCTNSGQCNVSYTKCMNSNVYKCTNSTCTIKYVCQNGCTPSDYQAFGEQGVEANCISTYNRFWKCSPDKTKILQCDGTYCTTIHRDCSATREVCAGTGSGVRCQRTP